MRAAIFVSTLGLIASSSAACGGAEVPAPSTEVAEPASPQVPAAGQSVSPEAEAPQPSSGPAQVRWGRELFAQHCSGCHGAGAAEGAGPPITGPAALPEQPPPAAEVRDVDFETAGDVLEFIRAHMPRVAPGRLADQEYLAVLAFILDTRGFPVGAEPLDAERADSVPLHAED